MGIYINPGSEGFKNIRNGEYVDKSGLIATINRTLDSPDMLTCLTRPRRFGKSFTAKMLSAYYSTGIDARGLFEDLKIAKISSSHGGGLERMGQYNVLYLDVSRFVIEKAELPKIVVKIRQNVIKELNEIWSETIGEDDLSLALLKAAEVSGKKFFAIIDEWDVVFREAVTDVEVQEEYIRLLRSLFKSSDIRDKVFSGALITGILPVKKFNTGSAMSDFREYTMLRPSDFAEFTGFTEEEVKRLSDKHDMDFDMMKEWYDGYCLDVGLYLYNPSSVMSALRTREYDIYWGESESYEELRQYIDMDFDDLQKSIIELIAGRQVSVKVKAFQNDISSIRTRDDVLTLLIHLGYLVYNRDDATAEIPNREVKAVFVDTMRNAVHKESIKLIRDSDLLISDTINGLADKVAEAVQKVHDSQCAPLFYNDEQALRSVIKLAYISSVDNYIRIEELPSGHGFADVVYFPKKNSTYPLLVIELKWNKTAEGGIAQIRNREYPAGIMDYGSQILLVGINYDEADKRHECVIERL